MRNLLTIVLLVLVTAAAQAQTLAASAVNPAALSPEEKRFVQGMLAWRGLYRGGLDGAWGPMSQQALAAEAVKEFGRAQITLADLALMARNFRREVNRGEWQAVHVPGADISFQAPLAQVAPSDTGGETVYADPARALLIRARSGSVVDTMVLHHSVIANSNERGPAMGISPNPQIVTERTMRDGQHRVHARSHRRGSGYATVVVQWTPERTAEARLVIASIADGAQANLALPKGSAMRKAMADHSKSEREEEDQPRDVSTLPRGAFAGTGFFVNNTDLVTAADLLERCGGLALRDGTALTALRAGEAPGLAVLSSGRRVSHWLPVDPEALPQRGQPVVVVGYPAGDSQYSSRLDGQVDGEVQAGAGERRMALTIPARAGLAGAPALDLKGRVTGVVVSGAGGNAVVVPGGRLARMLSLHRIQFDTRGRWPTSEVEAAPRWSDTADAVVSLFCR